MRIQGGSFRTRGHFKKWYKKVYLAIVDYMLFNAFIAWNLSSDEHTVRGRRKRLSRHGFYTKIAQSLLQYEPSESVGETRTSKTVRNNPLCAEGHDPVEMTGRGRCNVCMVEYRWLERTLPMAGMYTNIGKCAKCGLVAHLAHSKDRSTKGWKIHDVPCFKGMTCFKILHSKEGQEIFVKTPGGRCDYAINRSHPIIE